MKKTVAAFIVCLMVILSVSLNASAAEVTNEKEYKPLDLVVVMDTSGSMLDSDRDRLTPDAVKLLMSQVPTDRNRIGIVTFNTKAEKISVVGNRGLVPVENFAATESLKNHIDNVTYKGGTGIGNALLAATEILADCSDAEHSKGIVLFTDGVNDFGRNLIELAICNDNETAALLWAKNENCPIYCLGYDYLSDDGKESMGEEGWARLQNISDCTGGICERVHNISDARSVFEKFLAHILRIKITEIGAPIPGDGGYYEREIEVSSSVSEIDISIVGDKNLSTENADIHLYDPSQAEIDLINSGNVRYYTGKSAINIKVIMPQKGKWLLTLKGVVSDDIIHVNFLEHFEIELKSKFIFPDGNPEGVAYSNDIVGISVSLSLNGQELTDAALYDEVESAEAVCVSRTNPKDKKKIALIRDGLAFIGSFTIPEDSYYDVNIRLDWDSYYREITQEIASTNKPLYLIGKLENVSVNKKKTVEIQNIFRCVADDENDRITASIINSTNPDAVDCMIDGDRLIITGKDSWRGLWTSTVLSLEFRDAQGHTEPMDITARCIDPVAIALLICAFLLLIGIVLFIVYFVYTKSHKLLGCAEVTELTEGSIDEGGVFTPSGKTFKWAPAPVIKIQTEKAIPVSVGGAPGFSPSTGGAPGFSPSTGGAPGFSPSTGGAPGFSPSMVGGVVALESIELDPKEAKAIADFSKAVNFGGRRKHKLPLRSILEDFIKDYSNYILQMQIVNPKTPDIIKNMLSSIDSVSNNIYLLGSLRGNKGATLRIRRNMIKSRSRKLYFINPIVRGRITQLHYENEDKESRTVTFYAVSDDSTTPKKGVRVTVYLHYVNK